MADVFFTADSHFNHEMLLKYRPFETVADMNEAMIEHWNAVVRPGDVVWHLGDVAMGDKAVFFNKILPRLNGTINLITGNHDSCWSRNRNAHKEQARWLSYGFESIQAFARRKIGGQSVLLSHFPYRGDHVSEERFSEYRLADAGKWLIHGHVHEEWKIRDKQINVGVDVWDFAPVSLEMIQEIIDA